MAYTKTTWTTTTPITAYKFNHLESQYATAYADYLYNHNHNSRYYLKTSSDNTFYWAGFMGSGSGADADLLDGNHASAITGTSLPIGSIVMWGQTSASIPAGWHICDGTTVGKITTLDLRDKFVAGAGNTYDPEDTLGSATATPTSDSIAVNAHTITTAELPAHTHSFTEKHANTTQNTSYQQGDAYTQYTLTSRSVTTSTDGGKATPDGHTHTTGSSVTYDAESNIPAYYALYFIERVS